MGIKNLNKFFRDECPQVFEKTHLSNFSFKKGAVDISLFMYTYKAVFGDTWATAVLGLISCLRRNNIHCCFIYDTSAPEEKMLERQDRKEKRDKLDTKILDLEIAFEKAQMTGEIDPILRSICQRKTLLGCNVFNLSTAEYEIERIKKQSVKIEQADFDLTKDFFTTLGIPHFQAPVEAETMCCDLCKQGKVDFVLSEDTDVIAYETPLFVTKINTSEDTCVVIRYERVLEALGLSSQEFLDFCIMCGTDYNKNIPNIGPKKAYKLIKQYHSIENITSNCGLDTSILNHVRSRELFTGYDRFLDRIPFCSPPDISKLTELLVVNNIRYNVDKLENDFTTVEITFEDDD